MVAELSSRVNAWVLNAAMILLQRTKKYRKYVILS